MCIGSRDMVENRKKIIKNAIFFQSLFLLFTIIGIYMLRSGGLRNYAYIFFGAALLGSEMLYIILLYTKTFSGKLGLNTFIILLLSFTSCFFLFVNRVTLYQYVHPIILKLGFGSLLMVCLIESVYLGICLIKKLNKRNCVLGIVFFALTLVFCFINRPIFDTWVRWDSYAYLFDFYKLTPNGIFFNDGMHVAQHLSSAYGLAAVGLQSVLKGLDMRLVLCMLNIVFMVFDMILFYLIFEKYYPKYTYVNLLFALIFVFSPYIFGLTSSISLETFMLLSFLILIYADVSNNKYLLILGAFMLCNSKETGVIITCGFMIGRIIRDIILFYKKNLYNKKELTSQKKHLLKSFMKTIDIVICVEVMIIGTLWMIEFLQGNWISTNNGTMNTVDGSVFNSFGISIIYIADKAKSLLFANFNWVIFAIIFMGIIYIIIEKKRLQAFANGYILKLMPPLCGCVFGGIFVIIFITYSHFRYWTPFFGAIYLAYYIIIQYVFDRKATKILCMLGLGGLLFAQNYVTIDPVMLNSFPVIDIGSTKIVSTQDSVIGRNDAVFLDSSSYNHQIMYFDEALDMLLSAIEFEKENTAIIFTDNLTCPTVGGDIGSLHILGGFGYSYMDVPRYISWNENTLRRELSNDPNDEMSISYYSSEDYKLLRNLKKEFKNVYYIEVPWSDTGKQEINEITEKYKLQDVMEINHKGWKLIAYRF